MENVIVAQNSGEILTNTSTSSGAENARPKPESPELKRPRISQPDAPQDLDLVSWPPRTRLPNFGKMPGYKYDVTRGVDTYIYIIDNGINMDNAVRTRLRSPTHHVLTRF